MWLLYCVMVSIVIETHGYYDGEVGYFGYEDDLNTRSTISSTRTIPSWYNRRQMRTRTRKTLTYPHLRQQTNYSHIEVSTGSFEKTNTRPVYEYEQNYTMELDDAVPATRSLWPIYLTSITRPVVLHTANKEVQEALSLLFMGRNITAFTNNNKHFGLDYAATPMMPIARGGNKTTEIVKTGNETVENTTTGNETIYDTETGNKTIDDTKAGNKTKADKTKTGNKTKAKTGNKTKADKTKKQKATGKTKKTKSVATECKPVATTTLPTTTAPPTTRRINFDVDKFLEIVANLTYEYYTNLTEQVNETLVKMGAPTCATPATTPDYEAQKGLYRGRCYVCGLEDEGIPRDADCADAFSGDFVPLMPHRAKARGKLKYYRKYCMYKNVPNFEVNATLPKTVYGRFTGGCSVRWTDVTGVYTQRACRSRFKAITGKHFGSKRMARLEMALMGQDEGCIVSPAASLVPLSRGISLYARFYACVCTGNLCNATSRLEPAWCAPAILYWMMKFLYTSMSNFNGF